MAFTLLATPVSTSRLASVPRMACTTVARRGAGPRGSVRLARMVPEKSVTTPVTPPR